MLIKVPTPAAYIFHKGLIYKRRRDQRKMYKDLYYIFDILTGSPDRAPSIIKDFEGLSKKYQGWFQRLIKNIDTDFTGPASDVVLGVVGQRPPDAFAGLDDDQFKNFVFGTLLEIKETLLPLVRKG